MVGTYALSSGYYDAYYLKAQQLRHLISDDFKKAYEKVDVIMAPATPETAFNIGEKTDDPISMYLSDIYTIAVNLAGIPAMSNRKPERRIAGKYVVMVASCMAKTCESATDDMKMPTPRAPIRKKIESNARSSALPLNGTPKTNIPNATTICTSKIPMTR